MENKKNNKNLILVVILVILITTFLIYIFKDDIRRYKEVYEINKLNEGLPEAVQKQTSVEQLKQEEQDAKEDPFLAARGEDSIRIFTIESNRDDNGVQKVVIMIENPDFEQGKKEFYDWMAKKGLKEDDKFKIEHIIPYDYYEQCPARYAISKNDGIGYTHTGYWDIVENSECNQNTKEESLVIKINENISEDGRNSDILEVLNKNKVDLSKVILKYKYQP